MPVDALGARRRGQGPPVGKVVLARREELLHHIDGRPGFGLGALLVEVGLLCCAVLALDSEGKVIRLGRPKLVQQSVLAAVLVHHADHGEVSRNVRLGHQVNFHRIDDTVDGMLGGAVPVKLQGLQGLRALRRFDHRGQVRHVEHGVEAVAGVLDDDVRARSEVEGRQAPIALLGGGRDGVCAHDINRALRHAGPAELGNFIPV
mmetsp:Transcript_7095/g.20699  ORF Transcript_7095/g.20699 Transcript_7095/m.20699 type:complete len:204 (+) Transcript_7095:461-1072(+)